jgi:Tfp pilus assembly protein PilV
MTRRSLIQMLRQENNGPREEGFTLVEVTIASLVLLVGVLGTLTMLNYSNLATVTSKAREQGVSLQREIVEAARSIPYDQLSPNAVVARIQAQPDLGDDRPGTPGWQVNRRGVTYTVSVGTCSVDDTGDGTGAVDDAMFCPPGTTTSSATCRSLLGNSGAIQGTAAAATAGINTGNCGIDLNLDGQVDNFTRAQLSAAGLNLCALGWCPATPTDAYPDDYKRVKTLVRWNVGGGSRYALQSTTVPNPGSSAAPQTTALTSASGQTITSGTSLTFAATVSRTPAAVAWSVDGSAKGTATGAGTAWSFAWPIGTVSAGASPNSGEVLDGPYVVSAKAFDAYGASGQSKAVTVSLNRRRPYAPTRFAGGRNTGASGGSGVVDLEWAPSRERDLVGYRVYRVPTTGAAVQVCPATAGQTTSATSCQATGQPLTALVTYQMVAVDRDVTGALREGDPSATTGVVLTNTPPAAPGTLSASSSNGNVILSWAASAGDTDAGDSIAYYRIYRDGTSVDERFDRTGTGAELTWTDDHTNGVEHTYRVVAVDTQLGESGFSNAVLR